MQFDESTFDSDFGTIDVNRFERMETEYNEWLVDRVQDAYTATVHYTGNNDADCLKQCQPKMERSQCRAQA
ncbi:hypothetical protein HSB1_38750 [Halogranum salarium B-1]|uniref:Uncharacterized protein n=1 Tax=Halogranum salarium B-1 TaxID=1210908 RepID=J2ZAW1_9EURY|nr:hypothetical protein HSB1_38750 [Halogranum salarium B-1]